MKTYTAKPTDITRKWYILDASEAPLGRVATVAASLLLGKGKPTVSGHIDVGDFVIVINAAKLQVTGNKMADKLYYRHSGWPGGIKQRTLGEQMAQDPTAVITNAVRGMLPVNKLRPGRLKRLNVYDGSEHRNQSQSPEVYPLTKGNK